jgi:uncharacterized protein (TIGR03643 family)
MDPRINERGGKIGARTIVITQINSKYGMTTRQIDRIIEMAWEDRTPFEAIEYQFGLKENDVREVMRTNLKRSSFELWRKRVKGRKTKHQKTSSANRFRSHNQKL